MKKETAPVGPPGPLATISETDRAAWLAAARASVVLPPEEWIDAIVAGKPSKIVTTTTGEFLEVCALIDRQVLSASNVKWVGGTYTFFVYYPQPKQELLL